MAHIKDYQKQVHDLKGALNDLGLENQKLQVNNYCMCCTCTCIMYDHCFQ